MHGPFQKGHFTNQLNECGKPQAINIGSSARSGTTLHMAAGYEDLKSAPVEARTGKESAGETEASPAVIAACIAV
jgi:hypothetical protein